jgi:hypothetical protein
MSHDENLVGAALDRLDRSTNRMNHKDSLVIVGQDRGWRCGSKGDLTQFQSV